MATGNAPFGATTDTSEEEEAERTQKLAEAIAFLQHALAGGTRPAHDILHEAVQAGIAERTLYYAKAALGVASSRQGYTGGHWLWVAP